MTTGGQVDYTCMLCDPPRRFGGPLNFESHMGRGNHRPRLMAVDRIKAHLTQQPGATTRDLCVALKIHRRTAATSLKNLRDSGIILQHVSLRDARQTRHYLTTDIGGRHDS